MGRSSSSARIRSRTRGQRSSSIERCSTGAAGEHIWCLPAAKNFNTDAWFPSRSNRCPAKRENSFLNGIRFLWAQSCCVTNVKDDNFVGDGIENKKRVADDRHSAHVVFVRRVTNERKFAE